MLGNNFGLFGSPAKLRRMLRALRRITAPGARIIAQTLDPHRTRNPAHRAYHQRNRARGRMAGQVRIRVRHLGLTGPWFDYLFVSVDELKQLLQGSGWTVWRIVRDRTPQYLAIIERCE